VTDLEQMGQFTFGNLDGWESFATEAKPGDIVVTGSNFGAGSSRQQAVDCFKSLGVQAIVGRSFGAIYERNAINAGFPILVADAVDREIKSGDQVTLDLVAGTVTLANGSVVRGSPCAEVQLEIYRRGSLLGV
jgi:3-isopropylmalate dehydratase small subunit